jgi:cell division protein ZapA
MERRTVQLRVAGQTHRVVTTATDGDLKRFVSIIEEKLTEVSPRGRAVHPQALLLATLALAHDLEEERARATRIETRARETLSRLLERIDAALEEGGDESAAAAEAPSLPSP